MSSSSIDLGTPISNEPPTGPAGGNLGGNYPNPLVVATTLNSPLPVAQGGSGSALSTGSGSVTLNNTPTVFSPTIFYAKTITPTGTIGSITINGPVGTANFDTAMASLVVTNNIVGTSSIVMGVIRSADATAALGNIVPGAGKFTVTLATAPAGETSFGFLVIN